MSPLKTGAVSGKPYFNCLLQTEKCIERAVCFNPGRKHDYDNMQITKSPVKISYTLKGRHNAWKLFKNKAN